MITNHRDVINFFLENKEKRLVLEINFNSKIKDLSKLSHLIINSKGKIMKTDEKIQRIDYDSKGNKTVRYEDGDTFQDSFVDLTSIEVGKKPKITFNKKIYTNLLYDIVSIKKY